MKVKCHDCEQMVDVNSVHACDGSTAGLYDHRAFIQSFLDLNLEGWKVERDAGHPRLYHITEPALEKASVATGER